MYGDFSRLLDARSGRYSGVLAQQGRFLLDSELNEQTSIVLDYLRRLTTDLIGPFGGPAHHSGFEVEPLDKDGKCLAVKLSSGHYYVYGLRCEAPAPEQVLDDDDAIPIGEHEPPFVIYLVVWEQSVGAVQDANLVEPALGPGVIDTTRRSQVRWYPHATARLPLHEDLTSLDREAIAEAFHEHNSDGGRRPRLGARVNPHAPIEPGPSAAPVVVGYSGVENQLYRVEIHHGGEAHEATFKWSRDNGSVEIALEALSPRDADGLRTATLRPGWHELQRGLQDGDWVELVDDRWAPTGTPPPLMRVDHLLLAKHQLILEDAHSERDFDPQAHPFLRRWDQHPDSKRSDRGIPVEDADGTWFDLEDGVQVLFEKADAEYHRGDYWMIPARTASPTGILWPSRNADPLAVPPHGPLRYLAPLALVETLSGDPTDLRILFSHLPQAFTEANTAIRPVFKPDIGPDTTAVRISAEPRRFQLRSLGPGSAGVLIDLYDGLTVGRSPDCGAAFDLTEVSRRHAIFGVTGDGVTIMDLGSTNGTFVNGTRIEPRTPIPVSPGDSIEIGTEAVQLQLEAA
ncbi:MAG: FHA domain-containing protein [Solirubrobacterales bacterium]|nr:FHA domain-containing protein [Solirubrobacterales bacterium]MBV9805971.1 FHA domain-containing protein [Solirubrobacterales bacterium]